MGADNKKSPLDNTEPIYRSTFHQPIKAPNIRACKGHPKLTPELRERILHLRSQKHTIRHIATLVGVSYSTVHLVLSSEIGPIQRHKRHGPRFNYPTKKKLKRGFEV